VGYKFLNAGPTAELFIYNDIAWYGTSADQFRSELQAIRPKPLLVRISSNGGDPIDATAIYNLLASRKNTTTRVDGMAASAASIIAQAGSPREIVSNGWLMIHEPVVVAAGNEATMRSAAQALSVVKAGMVQTYAGRSGKSPEEIQALMAAETWYTAEQAKANGFVDTVVDSLGVQAAFSFDPQALAKFKNVPPAVLATLSNSKPPVCGSSPQLINNDATLMSKLSEFLNSFKPGPSEREQKLVRLLAKADCDPEALISSDGDEGLHRVIEAAITSGTAAEKTRRETVEANLGKIAGALTASGIQFDPEKLETLGASIQARVDQIASRKMVTAAASRGFAPVATQPGETNGARATARTYTEQCVEARTAQN